MTSTMNETIRYRSAVYGFVLMNVFIFGYRFLSPEHHFYPILDSMQHFIGGIAVLVIAAIIARAFATWQWRRKQSGQEKLM